MLMMAMRVTFECGHSSSLRARTTAEGYTHDWEVYVKGADNADIHHYIDRVVFHLHETFPKPKRVFKEPPYIVKESGYAGFVIPITIYLKNKDEPRFVEINYDLQLQQSGPPINNVIFHNEIFSNPNDEFKKRLLKGGASVVSSSEGTSERGEVKTAAPMVGKPKLSGSDVKKHRITEPKTSNTFNDLFGTPNLIENTKISPVNKKPSSDKTSSSKTASSERSDRIDRNSKSKHSPHKDGKKDRSVDDKREKKDKEKESSSKDKEKNKEKSRKPPSPSSSSSKLSQSHSSSKRASSPLPMKKSTSPPIPLKRPPSPKPKEKEVKKVPLDKEKEKSKESSKSTSDETKNERKKDKKKHKEDRDKEKKEKYKEREREKNSKDNTKSSEKKNEKHEKIEKLERLIEKSEKVEKPEKPDKSDKSEKSEKLEKEKEKTSESAKPSKESRNASKTTTKEVEKVKDEKNLKSEKSERNDKEKSKDVKSDKDRHKSKHKKRDKKDKRDGSRDREKKEKRDKSRFPIDRNNVSSQPPTNSTLSTLMAELPDKDSSDSAPSHDEEVTERSTPLKKKSTIPSSTLIVPNETHRIASPIPLADVKKDKTEKIKRDKSKSSRGEEKEVKRRKRKSEDKLDDELDVKKEKTNDREGTISPVSERLTTSQSPVPMEVDTVQSSKVKEESDEQDKDLEDVVSESDTNFSPDSNFSTAVRDENNAQVLSDDYVSQLKDLQHKIMSLQDDHELQRVVQVIAETGQYEVTKKTFDFDLCTLDRRTVQRLQQFFVAS